MQQAIQILDEMIEENEKYISSWCEDDIGYDRALEEAKSRIQALGDGWIPVTEILPDGKGNVIIFADTFVSEGYYYPIHNCWYRNENDVKPTHWMPLPLPPNK